MRKKIANLCLVTGIACLAAALFFAFFIGTVAVPILTITSIVLNSVGITLIRR